MYFDSSVPQAEKFQHVPEICHFTAEFQFCPLTLCQLKLSAETVRADKNALAAKRATIKEAR